MISYRLGNTQKSYRLSQNKSLLLNFPVCLFYIFSHNSLLFFFLFNIMNVFFNVEYKYTKDINTHTHTHKYTKDIKEIDRERLLSTFYIFPDERCVRKIVINSNTVLILNN